MSSTPMQNAYQVLGIGVITIVDLDSCGLSKTADAIIRKTYDGLLELNNEEKIGEELTKVKTAEIKNANNLIGSYDDRQEYNEFMRTNDFSFGPKTKNNDSKEQKGNKQFRQVSFNDNIDSKDCDFWEKYESITSPNSYDSPYSYDDCSTPSSDSESDQNCQDCDKNCSVEPMGCYWFVKQPPNNPENLRKCDDCRLNGFLNCMDVRPYVKIVRFSKDKLKNIITESQDAKNLECETKEGKELREIFWNDKKSQIMIEIASFVQECADDGEGMKKLCALIECAATL